MPRPPARPSLQLSLQFADARHRALLPRHLVQRCLRAALEAPAALTVRIVGAEEGQALNRDYRGKDYATNVLTFAYGEDETDPDGPPLSADLILCAPVVEAEAEAAGRPLVAHYAHLLVHGALHAQGWDHELEDEAEAMEARESALLTALGWPDPYAAR
ncbi:rRNA maturation RNase YbeY [Piscinibacter sp. Jin2]|uniref:Endoribonuclease YbeY n=1 Tax=Aquariibacter lacus TaxID=2801332 RepID=A0A9X1BQS0_9BURK|nr:rRNA maturation RNase YbeY [Piscinibacter lacus]MBL0718818.1 rRNA maturation RNase YbeY [Piscinibacter lacus]